MDDFGGEMPDCYAEWGVLTISPPPRFHFDLTTILVQYHTPARGALENMAPKGQTLCRQRAAYLKCTEGRGMILTLWYIRADITPGVCDIGQDLALGLDPDRIEIQYTTPVVYVYPGKYAALRLLSNISPPIL